MLITYTHAYRPFWLANSKELCTCRKTHKCVFLSDDTISPIQKVRCFLILPTSCFSAHARCAIYIFMVRASLIGLPFTHTFYHLAPHLVPTLRMYINSFCALSPDWWTMLSTTVEFEHTYVPCLRVGALLETIINYVQFIIYIYIYRS